MKKSPDVRKSRKVPGPGTMHGTRGGQLREETGEPMQELRPTVWIGKLGCTETIISEIADQLDHRKQVKVKWLRNTEVSPADVADRVGAILVAVRGRTMVLANRRPA